MYQRIITSLGVLAGIFALSGCVDPDLTYSVPAGLTAQSGATVVGSLNKTVSLLPDQRVYLLAFDNKMIPNGGRDSWPNPLLLPTGTHVLDVMACECANFNDSWTGDVALAVDLQPGESYQLHATLPFKKPGYDAMEMTAWVTDSKGNRVGQSGTTQLYIPH